MNPIQIAPKSAAAAAAALAVYPLDSVELIAAAAAGISAGIVAGNRAGYIGGDSAVGFGEILAAAGLESYSDLYILSTAAAAAESIFAALGGGYESESAAAIAADLESGAAYDSDRLDRYAAAVAAIYDSALAAALNALPRLDPRYGEKSTR